MRKFLILCAVAFVATCAPAPASTEAQEQYLPARWERYSRLGYIVTMPNGCQWIHYSQYNMGVAIEPYTGPDGKQVCVEPLQ